MRFSHVPQLIATAGPVRIEKVSGGYQLWNDYRFAAFFSDLRDAESRMERAGWGPDTPARRDLVEECATRAEGYQ
jgi:hypothetical protein